MALDGLVALVGIIALTFAFRPFASPRGPLDIALGLLASMPIAFRRQWPLVALLATACSVAALLALGRSPFPSPLSYPVAWRPLHLGRQLRPSERRSLSA
jgi:hypothetical protein